jgi:hypothetical protein
MRTVAAAESMAVTAIRWVRDLWAAAVGFAADIKIHSFTVIPPRRFIFGVPPQKSAERRVKYDHLLPSRLSLSVPESHRFNAYNALAD